jgi:hypothetical protein
VEGKQDEIHIFGFIFRNLKRIVCRLAESAQGRKKRTVWKWREISPDKDRKLRGAGLKPTTILRQEKSKTPRRRR